MYKLTTMPGNLLLDNNLVCLEVTKIQHSVYAAPIDIFVNTYNAGEMAIMLSSALDVSEVKLVVGNLCVASWVNGKKVIDRSEQMTKEEKEILHNLKI